MLTPRIKSNFMEESSSCFNYLFFQYSINYLNEYFIYDRNQSKLEKNNTKLIWRDLYEFKNSQVTSGGIAINELNDNFSLKKDNNIYVGGEMIDIDGECGGYNIGIAFLSGLYIGEVI